MEIISDVIEDTDTITIYRLKMVPIPDDLTEEDCTLIYTVNKHKDFYALNIASLLDPWEMDETLSDIYYSLNHVLDHNPDYEDQMYAEIDNFRAKVLQLGNDCETIGQLADAVLALLVQTLPQLTVTYSKKNRTIALSVLLSGNELQSFKQRALSDNKRKLTAKIRKLRSDRQNEKKTLEKLLSKFSMEEIAKMNAEIKKREKEKANKT